MLTENELAETGFENPIKPTAKKEKPVVVTGDPTRKVWVRCVTDRGPWSEDNELKFWHDYEINIQDALTLEGRHHVVILQTPTKKGN